MESQVANTESSSHSSDFDDSEILIGEQVILLINEVFLTNVSGLLTNK